MSDATGSVGASRDERSPEPRGRGRDLRVAVTGAVLVLLVWFAVANLQQVPIHFWVTSTKAPLVVVVALSGFLGAAVAGLAGRVSRRRRGSEGS